MQYMLIVGGGYMAQQIADFFSKSWKVTILDYPEIDITDSESVAKALQNTSPDLVINAAAHTNTHEAERKENHNKVFSINVQGVANLAEQCRVSNLRLVHISTGMMFDGQPPTAEGWRETDVPNPSSYYTRTKAWADWLLLPRSEQDNILITRIHTPVSRKASPKNLITKLTQFSAAATDQTSLTVVEDYLVALEKLLEMKATGVYHLVNSGTISFWEISEILSKAGLIANNQVVAKTTLQEINADIVAKGGAYQPQSILSNQKLAALGIAMPDVRAAIEQAIQHYS